MSEWAFIKSAPQDGRPLLLGWDGGNVAEGRWVKWRRCWVFQNGAPVTLEPDYWCPMPRLEPPGEVEDEWDMRCPVLTKRGTRCKISRFFGYPTCAVHANWTPMERALVHTRVEAHVQTVIAQAGKRGQ